MPRQNRVTPGGQIIASSARGTLMGNRGILHDASGVIVRHSRNSAWLICLLDFKNRRRRVMSPGTYTELFFLDEAVALTAGHRPCAECRRQAFRSYVEAINVAADEAITGARELDRRLNSSRRASAVVAPIENLPDGVFVVDDEDYHLVWQGALHRWTPSGYVDHAPIGDPAAHHTVVTPQLSVEALRHGYRPAVHRSVSESAPR